MIGDPVDSVVKRPKLRVSVHHVEAHAQRVVVGRLAAEIIKGLQREVVNVGRIGIRINGSEVRRVDFHDGAGISDSMNFFHQRNGVRNMFDHMAKNDSVEGIVFNRIGEHVEIVNDVHAWKSGDVEAGGARRFSISTAKIKDVFGHS